MIQAELHPHMLYTKVIKERFGLVVTIFNQDKNVNVP